MVDTRDLKSLDASRAGSSPAPGRLNKIFEYRNLRIKENNVKIIKLFSIFEN